ncbi:MAG: MFS transporter [Verrucomicrobiota bacterium]|jgi:Na+/melibiose symporter-like transporter
MSEPSQKLSFAEKAGYSCGDAAANFVFMSMILFQANFYTDVFGLSAGLAGTLLLVSRLWDAFFDPIMGVLADRTQTRWGRFRPWVLWTSVPWAVVMVLAYTTPHFGGPLQIAYAFVTNILLMTLYSANNMPYSALGGVMTGDVQERAKLNSYRFVSVNAAQFIVGGFTVPLVAKFALGHDQQYGWSMTMGLWAVLCLVLFLTTFLTTKERIEPISREKTPPRQDFADLLGNFPWKVMFCMTFTHFTILALRGGALYKYYMNYADKAALYDWLQWLGLTVPAGSTPPAGLLNWLGYIVLPDKSNVAGVAYSIVNMIGTGVTIIVILLSPSLAKRFGKKTVAVAGFGLASLGTLAFYFLSPTNIWGMIAVTVFVAVVYAPTISLVWAIYADVVDYSEWKTGRRATGMVFATICFALKLGLSLGAAAGLWILEWFYGYDAKAAPTPENLQGFRALSSIYVAVLFAVCTILLTAYPLNKRLTIQISDELAQRRLKAGAPPA